MNFKANDTSSKTSTENNESSVIASKLMDDIDYRTLPLCVVKNPNEIDRTGANKLDNDHLPKLEIEDKDSENKTDASELGVTKNDSSGKISQAEIMDIIGKLAEKDWQRTMEPKGPLCSGTTPPDARPERIQNAQDRTRMRDLRIDEDFDNDSNTSDASSKQPTGLLPEVVIDPSKADSSEIFPKPNPVPVVTLDTDSETKKNTSDTNAEATENATQASNADSADKHAKTLADELLRLFEERKNKGPFPMFD